MNKNILIVCTGNSCRSQMAEGYLRHFAGDRARIYSAGVETHGLNPKAVSIMKEDAIDISGHTSNHVDEYSHIAFDYVITVCDHASEQCPFFPGQVKRLHQNFPDPARIAGADHVVMAEFRKVRDSIKEFSRQFAAQYL